MHQFIGTHASGTQTPGKCSLIYSASELVGIYAWCYVYVEVFFVSRWRHLSKNTLWLLDGPRLHFRETYTNKYRGGPQRNTPMIYCGRPMTNVHSISPSLSLCIHMVASMSQCYEMYVLAFAKVSISATITGLCKHMYIFMRWIIMCWCL